MEKPNRADRRKNKFGGGRATELGGWPTSQPNPVFHVDPEPARAETPTATEDATIGVTSDAESAIVDKGKVAD